VVMHRRAAPSGPGPYLEVMSGVSKQNSGVGEASTWFDLGCALQDTERHREALSAFRQAEAIDPNLPFLRNKIASAHLSLQSYDEALDLYQAIVRDAPNDVDAWTDLCATAHRLQQWDKSLAAAERAFQINPNHAMQLFNYSTILGEFRRFKKARHLLNRPVSLTPGIDNLHLTLGLVQLAEGDFKNGWKNLQGRWGRMKKFSDNIGSVGPLWSGESLAQKIVVIWPEIWLGRGDLILLVRYAARLAERAKREDGLIVFSCFDPLYTLFTRSLAEHCNELSVSAFAKGMELQPQHFLGRKVFQCPLMS
jgi:tetratricopeptide (TPR) repeat protein